MGSSNHCRPVQHYRVSSRHCLKHSTATVYIEDVACIFSSAAQLRRHTTRTWLNAGSAAGKTACSCGPDRAHLAPLLLRTTLEHRSAIHSGPCCQHQAALIHTAEQLGSLAQTGAARRRQARSPAYLCTALTLPNSSMAAGRQPINGHSGKSLEAQLPGRATTGRAAETLGDSLLAVVHQPASLSPGCR